MANLLLAAVNFEPCIVFFSGKSIFFQADTVLRDTVLALKYYYSYSYSY